MILFHHKSNMDIKKLTAPLPIELVEFRVSNMWEKNWEGWAILLAYKDARADMIRLDEVVWPMNWKREHSRDNANCTVSIWDSEKEQWISKEDTGAESFSEKAKWLASDSFKRANFNWGIGRELYEYPFIFIKLDKNEWYMDKGKPKASASFMKNWIWESSFFWSKIIILKAKDSNNKQRFFYSDNKEPVPDLTPTAKNNYTKKQFLELAEAFNTWGRDTAYATWQDQQKDFEINKMIEEKVKKLWEVFKANQQIDEVDSIWKDAEATKKQAQWR